MFLKLTMLLTLSASAFAAESANKGTSQLENVPAGLIQLPAHSKYYSPYAFVVDKSARTLSIWQQTGNGLQRVAEYPADLGKNSGAKRNVGDKKTPEGIYFLLEMLEGKQIDFSLYGKRAFTTDYPNFFDKREKLTGSGIWLHSVPDDVPLTRGSRGCVVVRNDVIMGLDQYIKLRRTPILIQGSAQLVNQADLVKLNAKIAHWLDNWRTAWETKNIDSYISAYDPDFESLKMNRDQWKAYKENLSRQYKTINIKISKPAILADRDQAIVRFLQEYTSDQHADFGEKVLFLKRKGDDFTIVGEHWAPETSQTAREEIEATTASKQASAVSATD